MLVIRVSNDSLRTKRLRDDDRPFEAIEMLPVLLSASTVGELERAWCLLIQRISRAQEKLDRNFKKYRNEDLPPSPISTDLALYEPLGDSWEPEEVMKHLYSKIPSMNKLLTEKERGRLAEGHDLRSALMSPIELTSVFLGRPAEKSPAEIYYNKDGAKITETDPDSLLQRRTSTLPLQNRARFEITSTGPTDQSISNFRPGKEPWARNSEAGYDTAPTSVANPTPLRGNHLGVLDGISSAHQRFYGSSQNWHPSALISRPVSRGTIDLSIDGDERLVSSRTPYQPSYPMQPPADPSNFVARYAGAGAGGEGGGDDDDDDDEPPGRRDDYRGGQGPSRGGNGPGGYGGPNASHGGPSRGYGGNTGGSGPGGYGGGPPGGSGAPGGAGPPGGYPGAGQRAPYGYYGPTIKADLKLNDLPKWNGDFDTAISYFHKISELAAMGGDLPVALGFWLGQTLEVNSPAEEWYMTLPPKWKEYMQKHYLNYIETIKHYFLGRPWQQKMQYEFKAQHLQTIGTRKGNPSPLLYPPHTFRSHVPTGGSRLPRRSIPRNHEYAHWMESTFNSCYHKGHHDASTAFSRTARHFN